MCTENMNRTSDYFSSKSRLHWEHLQVNEHICKLNCNRVTICRALSQGCNVVIYIVKSNYNWQIKHI